MTTARRESLALALSGGGHRATLFAIGALLALVDRGLNSDVCQIASVSGGSITNAFVAQRCDFEKLRPGELDAIATELVRRVVTRGIIETRVLWAVVLLPGLIGASFMFYEHVIGLCLGLAFLVCSVALLIFSIGEVLERLLHRVYFADAPKINASDPDPSRIRSLERRRVEHVFCATDLVLGQPLYFSSHRGGTIWRRTSARSFGDRLRVESQQWQTNDISIAEIVRASASFPGIPPKRFSFGPHSGRKLNPSSIPTFGGRIVGEEPQRQPRVAFLGDGGLWNNLGSHVMREDRILRGVNKEGVDLLCINASAPGAISSASGYHVPGWALGKALFASIQVLNTNTVEPRIQNMREASLRRKRHGVQPAAGDSTDIVVDLGAPSKEILSLESLSQHRDYIRKTSSVLSQWRSDLVELVKDWGRGLASHSGPTDVEARSLACNIIKMLHEEPEGDSVARGVIDQESIDNLREVVGSKFGNDDLDSTPTTLGRVSRRSALRLVQRGYRNTYLQSLWLKPFSRDERMMWHATTRRIEAIVGVDEGVAHEVMA